MVCDDTYLTSLNKEERALLEMSAVSTPAEVERGIGRPTPEIRRGALTNAKLMVAHLLGSVLKAAQEDPDYTVQAKAEDVLDDIVDMVDRAEGQL